MEWIVFAIAYCIIWLLSRLPSKFLYLFSDFCAFFIWHVFPYRKKIVLKNLTLSFPDKQSTQIRKIAKQSYHHFCDTFIEAIAAIHMDIEKHNRKYRYTNPDLLTKIYSSGKDILLIIGHYANWEWLSSLPLHTEYKILAIYKTLHNKYFDRLFIRLRSKYGVIPVTKENTVRTIMDYKKKNIPILTYFLADQRPRWKDIQHWTTFMNQITPVILGPGKIAKKLNMAVVFFYIKKVRRGFYESRFVPVVMDPHDINPHEITEKYYQKLETMIRDKPEDYLWTHNRWKHTKLYDQYLNASVSELQQ